MDGPINAGINQAKTALGAGLHCFVVINRFNAGRMRLGWLSERRRQANFFEDVVTEVSSATNLGRSTCFLYVADYKDVFLGAFHSGVDARTAAEIVANWLISLTFQGRPHTSPLVAKYDHGIKRKYDPMAISYCVLLRNPSDFQEILAEIAAVIREGEEGEQNEE